MFDDTLMEHTPWVALRAAWRTASNEVALAAALRQSEDLERMVVLAKELAYMVTLNKEVFDIHQVDDQWVGRTISEWNQSRLSQIASAKAPAARIQSRTSPKL